MEVGGNIYWEEVQPWLNTICRMFSFEVSLFFIQSENNFVIQNGLGTCQKRRKLFDIGCTICIFAPNFGDF